MRPQNCKWIALFLALLGTTALVTAQQGERRPRPEPAPGKPAPPSAGPEEKVKVEPARPEPIQNGRISVCPLSFIDADTMAKVLQHLQPVLGERLMAIPIGRSNQIVLVTESDEQEACIHQLITSLDRPGERPAPDDREVQSIRLPNASAKEVGMLIDQLYGGGPRPAPLRWGFDEQAKMLYLSGPQAVVDSAAKLAQQIGDGARARAELPQEKRELRFYTLAHADAVRLAASVNAIMETMEMGLRVVPDPESGTLIAHATSVQDAELQKIVAKLDVPAKRAAAAEAPAEAKAKVPAAPRPPRSGD